MLGVEMRHFHGNTHFLRGAWGLDSTPLPEMTLYPLRILP